MKLMDAELARLKLLEAAQSNAGHLDKVAEEADKGIAQAAEFPARFRANVETNDSGSQDVPAATGG